MTPQFILRAGLSDYLAEHCDGAGRFIPKSGLNPPPAWDTRENFIREAESEIDNLDWFPCYASRLLPPYETDGRGILIANWNHVSHRTGNLLERYGYTLDWSDQISRCDDCGRAVSDTPGCYGDVYTVVILGDGAACLCPWCAIDR